MAYQSAGDLDVALAASYLKRVSLSSSALDELIEEESTRKLRRVNSSSNLEDGQNVGSTGVRFDGSPKADQKSRRLRAEVDPLRRVVSADDILSRARVALAAEAIAEEPALPSSTTVSDDGTMDLADAEAAAAAAETATPAALAASLDVLEERSLLGPVEMGRCRELAAADDAFVRRGLLDALANALDKDQWAELGALVDIHRRARPYVRGADLPLTRRGAAAASDADHPAEQRGRSAETTGRDAGVPWRRVAAATRTFGRDLETGRGRDADVRPRPARARRCTKMMCSGTPQATQVGCLVYQGDEDPAAAFHVTAEDESPDAWSASGVAALAVRQGVRAIGVVLGLLSAASTEVDVCAACAAVEDGVVHVVLVHADDVVATVSGATITCADAATGAPAPCLRPAAGACRAISAWETGCGHGRLLAGDADQVSP